jgi:allantoinase
MAVAYSTSRIAFGDREGLEAWPGGARMAVLVYTAAESWLWDENETIKPLGTFAGGRGALPTLSTRTAVSYGYHVGMRRLAEIYRAFGMRTTVWTSGVAAEQFPDVLAELVEDGHELGGHGYSQGTVMAALSRDAQEEAIAKSVRLLASVGGRRPAGWISPGAEASEDTVELLAAAGFDYHGDLQDDELPYFVHVGEKIMVEVPYRLVGNLNDLSLLVRNVNSVCDATRVATDAFDAYYQAAGRRPLVFNYGTHPYVSGRPDTAQVLMNVLEHIHRHEDVWVTSYGELASWWRQRFASRISPATGSINVVGL